MGEELKYWLLDKERTEMAIDYLLETRNLSENVVALKGTGRPKIIYTIHPSITLPSDDGEKN